MAFLAQVSTQQLITKAISTLTLDVSSITGINLGSAFPGFPSTFSTSAVNASSINASTLRIGTWSPDEAASIAINDPTAATTSSGMLVMRLGQGSSNQAAQIISTVFSTPGSTVNLYIPSYVNNVYVQVWGAGGCGNLSSYNVGGGNGGGGAYLAGYLSVNPNSNLYVIVGAGGQSTFTRGIFASGAGGAAGNGYGNPSGQGGGFSAVFGNYSTTTGTTSSFLVIAGGGGGAGNSGNGGWAAASGTSWTGARMQTVQKRQTQTNGYNQFLSAGGGGGQSVGGDGAQLGLVLQPAGNGSNLSGGNGVAGEGGGGGGYFGGGGGSANPGDFYDNAGGGGGSSYGDLLKNAILSDANISRPGGITAPGYIQGAGYGGTATATAPINWGSNGLVIISYTQPAAVKNKKFMDLRDTNNSTISFFDSNAALAIQRSTIFGGYSVDVAGPVYFSTAITDFLQTSQANIVGQANIAGPTQIKSQLLTSSLFVQTQTTVSSLLVGLQPFQSYMAFYGNQGDYNRSVIAEQSNGTVGANFVQQELLLFRGANTTDRIRMQTTGYITFESGVSSRTFPNTPSNATPAMIINTSSNVGIQTASPTVPLDVAGTGRFQTLSSLALQISSINGQVFGSFSGSTNSLSSGSLITSSLTARNITALNISTGNVSVSTITTLDQNSANASGLVYQKSTFLYYNSFIFSGTKQAFGQILQLGIGSGSGGNITYYTSGVTTYTVHSFTTSASFSVSGGNLYADIFVLGGGGGGGGQYGGGGGAGGFVYMPNVFLTSGNYTVTIGQGGTGSTTNGTNGSNSVFSNALVSYTGIGGGTGGSYAGGNIGSNGGCGGGGAGNPTSAGGVGSQGYNGGIGGSGFGGAGGGGMGGPGSNSQQGTGGIGSTITITGSSVVYAGGGGGGNTTTGTGGTGGGGSWNGSSASAGSNGLGGGGGGGGNGATGANGGSGIIIIRYPPG